MQKDNQNNWEYERRKNPSLPKKPKPPGESNPRPNAPGKQNDPTKKPKRKTSGF
jgi:hypothetical protein